MAITSEEVAAACTAEARRVLRINAKKIHHCLDQLTDEHVNWRPFEQQNSIGNVILHLCGNVRQWIISGLGGAPDHRDRAAEFADRAQHTRAELLQRLDETVAEADAVLARLSANDLLSPHKIQGFDETGMSAMWHAVVHFEGHAHEIVYITRFLIRDKYKFMFVPANKTSGSLQQ